MTTNMASFVSVVPTVLVPIAQLVFVNGEHFLEFKTLVFNVVITNFVTGTDDTTGYACHVAVNFTNQPDFFWICTVRLIKQPEL